MKEICGTNVVFASSNVRTDFYEFPANWITIDEYDLCVQENLIYAVDRLGADAEGGRTRKFGNPTIAGSGIDKQFINSDQKFWFVRCNKCTHPQVLSWFGHFVDDGTPPKLKNKQGNPICEKCGKPFDRTGQGEWVAKYPDNPISGYAISKLFADRRSGAVNPILDMFSAYVDAQGNATMLQRFWNNDLGEPYEAEGSKITDAMLAACATGSPFPANAKADIGGCDVGGVHHLHASKVVDGKRVKVFAGTVSGFPELERVVRDLEISVGVIDAMPETHSTREFCRNNPGWIACYYNDLSKKKGKPDYKERTIVVGRTETLDASYQDYAMGKVVLPVAFRSIDGGDFLAQMTAPTRIYDEAKNKFVWDEGSRPDHHRHADNYEKIASGLYHSGGSLISVL